jgi:hypothetical protein
MSKNLSLDIKTAYQLGLVISGLIAVCLIIVNLLSLTQVFGDSVNQPSAKIREQQLMQAIQLVQASNLEN